MLAGSPISRERLQDSIVIFLLDQFLLMCVQLQVAALGLTLAKFAQPVKFDMDTHTHTYRPYMFKETNEWCRFPAGFVNQVIQFVAGLAFQTLFPLMGPYVANLVPVFA